MHLKREVVFLKEGEPSNPVRISEIVVMGHSIVHGDFLMIVKHVSYTSHSLVLTVTLENILCIASRQVTVANYSCVCVCVCVCVYGGGGGGGNLQ